jgi:hypothetical protein
MAKKNGYLDYLDSRIGIAPTNSQEELNAAQTIAEVFETHGLQATTQEFDAPAMAPAVRGALMVLLFLGVLLAGIGGTALALIGLLVVIAATVLLVLPHVGRDPLSGVGPTARSQNVIARHEACGDLAARGNRPIVIVAHYDSPRESILSNPAISRYQSLVIRASVVCVPVVVLCALVQVMGFAPDSVRRTFWVLGIIAALFPLVGGISALSSRFMPCTEGSNDNKAAVACMLDVLDAVRPGVVPAQGQEPPAQPGTDDADVADGTKALMAAPAPEGPQATRHGADVLRSLGMLPKTCEITYVEPEAPVEAQRVSAAPVVVPSPDDADEADPGATKPMDPSIFVDENPDERSLGDDASGLDAMSDDDAEQTAPMDPVPTPAPPSVDDPEWGKSSYRPGATSFARRVSLFDLPDPSVATVDPLASNSTPVPAATAPTSVPVPVPAPRPASSADMARRLGEATSQVSSVPAPVRLDSTVVADPLAQQVPETPDVPVAPISDDISVIHPPVSEVPAAPKPKKGHLFRRKSHKADDDSMSQWLGVDDDFNAKDGGRELGSWENLAAEDEASPREDPNGSHWKGGATRASGLRDVDTMEDGDQVADLADSILQMGDERLLSHDVWFVALGASSLDHAGMKAFLADYRKSVRGAFMINLDCIGAGEPTILSEEGLTATRKADRRLTKLLTSTADDLHIPLATQARAWEDTDATPAMRSSVRAVTIMGETDGGVRALSGTKADVPEAIDADQVASIARLVTEAIRRS